MADRAERLGMDKRLEEHRAATYSHELETECRQFLSELVGRPLEGDLMEVLKTGVVLCEAINKIKPGTVKSVSQSKFPFHCLENINKYIDGCRALGVPEYDLFTSVDLYEARSPKMILQNIDSLGRAAQRLPGYAGPRLGVKDHDPSRGYEFAPRKATVADWPPKTGYTGAPREFELPLNRNLPTKDWK